IHAVRQSINGVNDQVEIVQRRRVGGEAVGGEPARRAVENGREGGEGQWSLRIVMPDSATLEDQVVPGGVGKRLISQRRERCQPSLRRARPPPQRVGAPGGGLSACRQLCRLAPRGDRGEAVLGTWDRVGRGIERGGEWPPPGRGEPA